MTKTLNHEKTKHPEVQVLGEAVPKRGNKVTMAIAHFFLRITGWRIIGEVPNLPKMVVIGAPHTSYWDFWLAMMIVFSLGIRIEIMGMAQLFKFRPVGAMFRWAGVFPVVRESSNGVVDQVAKRMKDSEQMFLGVSPEGTRKKVTKWRTGFYHIAQKANVPILPVGFIFPEKKFIINPAFTPTGDKEADIKFLQAYYEDAIGKHKARS